MTRVRAVTAVYAALAALAFTVEAVTWPTELPAFVHGWVMGYVALKLAVWSTRGMP